MGLMFICNKEAVGREEQGVDTGAAACGPNGVSWVPRCFKERVCACMWRGEDRSDKEEQATCWERGREGGSLGNRREDGKLWDKEKKQAPSSPL